MLPVYILLGILIVLTLYYVYLKFIVGFETQVVSTAGTPGYYGVTESFTGASPETVDISYTNNRIGPYDGVRFSQPGLTGTVTADHLRGQSNQLANPILVPQGTPSPLDAAPSDLNKDGMFLFAFNESKPECCPSTYSSDTGCVCTTDN